MTWHAEKRGREAPFRGIVLVLEKIVVQTALPGLDAGVGEYQAQRRRALHERVRREGNSTDAIQDVGRGQHAVRGEGELRVEKPMSARARSPDCWCRRRGYRYDR